MDEEHKEATAYQVVILWYFEIMEDFTKNTDEIGQNFMFPCSYRREVEGALYILVGCDSGGSVRLWFFLESI